MKPVFVDHLPAGRQAQAPEASNTAFDPAIHRNDDNAHDGHTDGDPSVIWRMDDGKSEGCEGGEDDDDAG